MFACIYGPDANRLADSFSPFVEMVDEKTAVFSVTPRQLGRLKDTQAAVAVSVEAAILAARNLPGYTFIPPGEEARVLGALSIDALPPDPELFETFHLWGIRSLADLSRLPDDALASRLGARGLWLQRLARGAFERPLRPRLPAAVYEESAELEHPIKLREPLLFLIARFLHDLTARLKSQSLAAAALCLTLNGNQRTHSVPFATRDVKLLLKLVEHSLERQPPDAPIAKIRLELVATEPRRVQHGLFAPAAPEPEKLELTLGKIRGLVGRRMSDIRNCSIRIARVWPDRLGLCCRFDISVLHWKRGSLQNVYGHGCFKAKSSKSPGHGDRAATGGVQICGIATNTTWRSATARCTAFIWIVRQRSGS